MRLYEPERDELLMLYWFLNLRADPVEFENLFVGPQRTLTNILNWAKNSVNVMIDVDAEGIRFAAWVAPYLSIAEFGSWARKDSRGTKAHLKFMDEAYDKSLAQYPVLIGLTKQEKLHNLHLSMGYEFKTEIEQAFDGTPARVYVLTRASRANRQKVRQEIRDGRRRKFKDLNRNGVQPIRTPHSEVLEGVPAVSETVRATGSGSPEDGRRKRADSDHKPRRGRKPRSRIRVEPIDTGSPSTSGAG